MSFEILLDTPEKTITFDTFNGMTTIVERFISSSDIEVSSTSYFSSSNIVYYEERDTMSFYFSAVHNIEILHCILKILGIQNYTWLRYSINMGANLSRHEHIRDRISMTFTDEADYAFFKFKFFNQIKNANPVI